MFFKSILYDTCSYLYDLVKNTHIVCCLLIAGQQMWLKYSLTILYLLLVESRTYRLYRKCPFFSGVAIHQGLNMVPSPPIAIELDLFLFGKKMNFRLCRALICDMLVDCTYQADNFTSFRTFPGEHSSDSQVSTLIPIHFLYHSHK